jgi:GNAT superfamily N-acetyltransferase
MTVPHPAIREATRDDAAELSRLLTILGHPTTTEEIRARWAGWVAEGNSALVVEAGARTLAGVATLHVTTVLHRPKPVGRITALVVDPSRRGEGLGGALVAAAETALAQAGCGLLEVTSNMRRGDAHAFYEHLGYERTSYRFVRDLEMTDRG